MDQGKDQDWKLIRLHKNTVVLNLYDYSMALDLNCA